MGFKSKSIEKSQLNNCNRFKVGGLIFDSEEDYLILKNIDSNINQIVKSVEDGGIDLKDVFNNVKTINVEESYDDAWEEIEGLFKNATDLLCYEDTRFVTDYEVGRCFFDKIHIL